MSEIRCGSDPDGTRSSRRGAETLTPASAGKPSLFRVLLCGAPAAGCRTTLAALAGEVLPAAEGDGAVVLPWASEDGSGPWKLRIYRDESARAVAEPPSRRLFLANLHGVLFVVDPRRSRLPASQQCLERLRCDLAAAGRSAGEVPLIFQLNKLDLPLDGAGASHYARMTGCDEAPQQLVRAPVASLRRAFCWPVCDYAETIADVGIGVRQALDRLLELARSQPSPRAVEEGPWDSR